MLWGPPHPKGPSPVTRSEPADPASAAPPSAEGSTRRLVLGAGLASVVVAVAGARSVSATTPPDTGPGLPAADVELLSVVQGLELSIRDLYDAAIAAGADPDVFATLAYNHRAYGQSIAGATGVSANERDEQLFSSLEADFATSDTEAVAAAAYDLESRAVATYTELLPELLDVGSAKLMASIVATEARHCTVLAVLAGRGDELDALLENTAEPITPESTS
jgi:hypothetical protein